MVCMLQVLAKILFLQAYVSIAARVKDDIFDLDGQPCNSQSLSCLCDTPALSDLPLISGGSRHYGVPTITTFRISGKGYMEYRDLPSLAGLICKEEAKPDIESMCNCHTAKGESLGMVKLGLGCFYPSGDIQAAMCEDFEPEFLECHAAFEEDPTYVKVPADMPEKIRTYIDLCKVYQLREDSFKLFGKRSWCTWEANVPDDYDEETLTKACSNAVPNQGWANGQQTYFEDKQCGYNTKLSKCLQRLNTEYIKAGPWAKLV